MKKIILLLFTITATLSVSAQKVFEGYIKYGFNIEGENMAMMESMMPTSMELFSSKKALMVKMNGGMMASMFGNIVSTAKESFMLKESEETAYMIKTDDAAKNENPKVVKEDEVITINGLSCRKYKVTKATAQGEQTAYIWLNSDYKLPATGKSTDNMTVPGVPGIAMKTMTSTQGMTVVLTANEFKTGKQDKKHFTIPKGYVKKDFDPSSMMGF